MARMFARIDIYVQQGDGEPQLQWENGIIFEDRNIKRLRVSFKHKPVAVFTDYESLPRVGTILNWRATDADGNMVLISGAPRRRAGCQVCGT